MPTAIAPAAKKSAMLSTVTPPVAMNGRCFPWDDVRKNKKTGIFESLGPEG